MIPGMFALGVAGKNLPCCPAWISLPRNEVLILALPPLHFQVVESRRSSTGHAGPSVEDQIDAIGFGKLQIIAILATCVSLERCLLHTTIIVWLNQCLLAVSMWCECYRKC